MEFIKSTGTVSTEAKYLDMKRIPEYVEIARIAYVHDVSIGQTKYQDGFVKFFLKDCNSNVVVARLFQIEDFLMSGVNAAAFKHKPVEFKGVVQIYNGNQSLVISGKSGIKIYDGPFDYALFVGCVEADLSGLVRRYIKIESGWEAPISWSTDSIDTIAFGRAGGFAKVVEISYKCVLPFLTDKNEKELMRSFITTMDYWFRYVKRQQNVEVLGSLEAYTMLQEVSIRYDSDECKLLFLDCLRAVLGLEKPLHLYAHIIMNAVEYAKNMLSLTLKFDGQPFGTKCYAGGVELSKY